MAKKIIYQKYIELEKKDSKEKGEKYKMAIYINGRFLTKKLTGIQRYAMEVLKEIDNLETNEEIILLQPKGSLYDFDFKNIKIKQLNFLQGNLWEQISIPFYLFNKKKTKLISLFNSAPILHPRICSIT